MEKLKEYLECYPQAKILDIGTGRGDFIALIDYLYNDYSEIIGIDIIDYLLEMNQNAFKDKPKVKFIEDDILKTNLAQESFDIVCLSNTLHHLPSIDATLKEMKKLVKAEGIIIINEMISDNLNSKQTSHKLLHHFAAKVDRQLGRIHEETFTEEKIIEILKNSNNLKIVDNWQMEYDLPNENDNINGYLSIIDRLLNQVKDCQRFEEFRTESEDLKSYLKEHGFSAATQVVVILKK